MDQSSLYFTLAHSRKACHPSSMIACRSAGVDFLRKRVGILQRMRNYGHTLYLSIDTVHVFSSRKLIMLGVNVKSTHPKWAESPKRVIIPMGQRIAKDGVPRTLGRYLSDTQKIIAYLVKKFLPKDLIPNVMKFHRSPREVVIPRNIPRPPDIFRFDVYHEGCYECEKTYWKSPISHDSHCPYTFDRQRYPAIGL